MNKILLRLSEDERDVLRRLLDSALAESRVEAYRTYFSPWYREEVLEEQSYITGLLRKLREPVNS